MDPFTGSGTEAPAAAQPNASRSPEAGYSPAAAAGIAALVGLLVLVTVVGNVLVAVAVLTSRALRAPQNLFLVSLAAADVLVAALVMPFSLANELMGYWCFGRLWCGSYLALDVWFCTASIAHLCAISLDRYWSVTRAVEYNLKRTPRRVKGAIALVWLASAVVSSPPLVSGDAGPDGGARPRCQINDQSWYILSSSVASFFAPCLVMVLVYLRIYQVAKTRTRSLSEKEPERSEAAGTEDGPSRAAGQNGHCRSPPTPSRRTATTGPERSSSSEGKGQTRERQGSGQEQPPGSGRVCRAGSGSAERLASRRKRRRRRSASARKKASQAREKRLTLVLAVVMGAFVLCWFPFFFSYSLYGLCRDSCRIPDPLFKFFFWLGYCNSSLNPAIYTIFNRDFRRAFQKILCRSWRKSF